MQISDPLAPILTWSKRPEHVLVIKKPGANLRDPFLDIIFHLLCNHNLNVYVEETEFDVLRSHPRTRSAFESDTWFIHKFIRPRTDPSPSSPSLSSDESDINIDFIVCLGGDGTLLHASSLFQNVCPPVLSINAGSLGFLCPFDFENYKNYLNGVIKGNVPILYRNRLKFKLEKSTSSEDNETHHENPEVIIGIEEADSLRENEETEEINNPTQSPANDDILPLECLSLNEIIISRGANSYLSNLDLYINDYLITTVQGDGLIVSTPTGSTAYAMAAGASMCHPSVAAMVIAPICPHSLSFRPIVVPMGVKLKIALNVDARTTEASCSIDGRVNTKLRHEWHVSITASEHPVPFICRSDQINEWFEGLAYCLHWNDRPRQLPLNSGFISKSRSPSRSRSHSSFSSAYVMSSSTSSLSTSAAHQQLTVPPCLSCPSCPNLINEHYDTDSEAVVFTVKCCEDIKE